MSSYVLSATLCSVPWFAAVAIPIVPVTAQLAIEAATSAVGLAVTNGAPGQSMATGVDVSTGFSLHSAHPSAFETDADVALVVDQTAEGAFVRLRTTTRVGSGYAFPLPTSTARARVDVVLRSPIPVEYEVDVVLEPPIHTFCTTTRNGTVMVPGSPIFDVQSDCSSGGSPTCRTALRLTVGPAGVRIVLVAETFATQAGHGFGCTPAATTGVGIDVRAVPPATAYGAPCGNELLSFGSLNDPTRGSIVIDGPNGSTFNLISVATGQGFFMMSFGCPCLVSPIFVSVALPVDVFGDSSLAFASPPPGIFTMQALSVDPSGGFHLSNGLQF